MHPASRDRTRNAKVLRDAAKALKDAEKADEDGETVPPLRGFRKGRHPRERRRKPPT